MKAQTTSIAMTPYIAIWDPKKEIFCLMNLATKAQIAKTIIREARYGVALVTLQRLKSPQSPYYLLSPNVQYVFEE